MKKTTVQCTWYMLLKILQFLIVFRNAIFYPALLMSSWCIAQQHQSFYSDGESRDIHPTGTTCMGVLSIQICKLSKYNKIIVYRSLRGFRRGAFQMLFPCGTMWSKASLGLTEALVV